MPGQTATKRHTEPIAQPSTKKQPVSQPVAYRTVLTIKGATYNPESLSQNNVKMKGTIISIKEESGALILNIEDATGSIKISLSQKKSESILGRAIRRLGLAKGDKVIAFGKLEKRENENYLDLDRINRLN